MKLQPRRFVTSGLAVLIAAFCGGIASADFVEDFRVNTDVAFEFGAYPGNYEFTADGLDLNIPASGDSFGGLGINASANVALSPLTAIEVTARLESGNGSPLIVAIRELGSEFFSYSFDQSLFVEGEFVTVSIDANDFFFNGEMGDGVINGVLENTGIQSPFGGTAAQNFTVRSVRYVSVVPEPGSLALLIGLCPWVALRRKRS